MPAHRIGKKPMTNAQRQQLYRDRHNPRSKFNRLLAKQQRRVERETALAARIARATETLGTKLYGVVYMDPATRFEVWCRDTGLDRAADNHYPTEFWDDIASRPPPAYKDSILLCWSTRAQMMATGRMIEDRWGHEYKTCSAWSKEGRGTGYIVIDNCELLLIFSRGNPVWPAPGTQDLALRKTVEPWEGLLPPLIETERGRHSEKPEIFAESIERLWPNTQKLEMYYEPKKDPEAARAHIEKRQSAGWDLWPPP